jgi:hypothetical protein
MGALKFAQLKLRILKIMPFPPLKRIEKFSKISFKKLDKPSLEFDCCDVLWH